MVKNLFCGILLAFLAAGLLASGPKPTPTPGWAAPPRAAGTTPTAALPASPVPTVRTAVYEGPVLVVLCYHQFGTRKDGGDATYRVEPSEFAWQMDFLRQSGWRFVALDDVKNHYLKGADLPEKSVLLTFDDGFRSIFTKGWPEMRKRRVPGVVFLYTDFLKSQCASLRYGDLAVMGKEGMAVGSHSRTHPNLAQWKDRMKARDYRAALKDEMEASRDFLAQKTGKAPDTVAYPFGVYNDDVVAAARDAGYRLGFTVDPGPNDRTVNALRLRRELVTFHTSRRKFAGFFERRVLHLADLSPEPGAVSRTRDIKVSARILDDVDPATVTVYLGQKRLPGYRYDPATRTVFRRARMPIFRAGHLLTVQARDRNGVTRTFSWYFRVRQLKGYAPGEAPPKGADAKNVDVQKPASDASDDKK